MQSEKASPVELGESSPAELKGLSPLESKRLSPVKPQLKDHPPAESFPFTNKKFNPQQDSVSPATVIHPQLNLSAESSVEHVLPRVISLSVYSPAELSSPAGLFSQSSLFTTPSGNEEFSSFLQQQSGIYFPQDRKSVV